MRLLQASGDDDFVLIEFTHNVPRYAILSHTWGADEDEVTFKDICKGKGKGKPGYAKLQFCAAQAAKDYLEFFWVDTCCIDKSSSAELAEAINSMFKWYRDSSVCYVYLSDVTGPSNSISGSHKQPVLGGSRWFERGWTLQELLAPSNLVFFSMDGARIGDKASLAKEIAHETAIPMAVFVEGPQSIFQYDIEQRLSWAKDRRTKRDEDGAYCLLGIFEVQMPLIYGEGRAKAFSRLQREIDDVYGRRDWMDDILQQYGLPSLRSLHTLLRHIFANCLTRHLQNDSLETPVIPAPMRLLAANGDDDFSLVESIDDIPPYAILSHTRDPDHEEVTFKHIHIGKGKTKTKLGYEKLRFCGT
ncbi:hypothetical protein G6011_04332 [Alternaria panax]|uniref:Heterokaryon incompatibility domain-containing protein n=1 Tax=Alternaria panax TaxID=48097 RepID=A0AAD4IGT4_9PLEO|nr:hypothetical protein G6011_04332 [Alternaria panax]